MLYYKISVTYDIKCDVIVSKCIECSFPASIKTSDKMNELKILTNYCHCPDVCCFELKKANTTKLNIPVEKSENRTALKFFSA